VSAHILVVAEHADGALAGSTARTLTCARCIPDAEITVVVFAERNSADEIHPVADQAAALAGVSQVSLVLDPAHAHPIAACVAPMIAELSKDFSHVLGPATTFGKDLMPRVAALLGVAQVSDIIAVETASRYRRPIYAGNAIATVEVLTRPIVGTVRTSAFEVAVPQDHTAPIEILAMPVSATHTQFVSASGAHGDRPDLQSARRVVTGGRGMGSPAGFARLERLADLLGAAIGATRAAVDAGFAPNELQVGQTGKVIAPQLYLALGVSGAIQHLAGIKDAHTIVAVNKDSEAPIFEIADIGLVADLETALPELERLLESMDPKA
jgi:electron transfer flavoprotein alpha subunit